jgi:hypothetical protein
MSTKGYIMLWVVGKKVANSEKVIPGYHFSLSSSTRRKNGCQEWFCLGHPPAVINKDKKIPSQE